MHLIRMITAFRFMNICHQNRICEVIPEVTALPVQPDQVSGADQALVQILLLAQHRDRKRKPRRHGALRQRRGIAIITAV